MGFLAALIKTQKLITLPSTATVSEAAEKMAKELVGSIIIMDGGKLSGIFTERDLLNRVVAKNLNAATTSLAQVMSKNVKTVSVHETMENCFKKMEETKCRHIPIVDGSQVVGVVTMRNILEGLMSEIAEENIQLKKYIQS